MRRGKRKKEKIGRKCEWEQMKLFAATGLQSCTRADKQIFAETKQKTTTQGRMKSNGMEMIWTRSRTRENREDEGGEVSQRRGINCNCWLWSRKEHWTDKAWQGEETSKRWENEEPKGRPNSADRWKRNDRWILHSAFLQRRIDASLKNEMQSNCRLSSVRQGLSSYSRLSLCKAGDTQTCPMTTDNSHVKMTEFERRK